MRRAMLVVGSLLLALWGGGCSARADRAATTDNLRVDGGPPDLGIPEDTQPAWEIAAPCLTSVSGTVLTPSPKFADPVYNAVVYILDGPPPPVKQGVSCDRCSDLVTTATVIARTGYDGKFELVNVPPGKDVKLVLQVGKWRKVITLDVERCTSTTLPPDLTHLPRTRAEGDIPQMAIVTGGSDPLHCLLLKMGIDPSEFTYPWESGRVHVFQRNGIPLGSETPEGELLWEYPKHLSDYDIVMLPCEGAPTIQSAAAIKNIIDYTTVGGRLFTTHYGYTWMTNAAPPFSTVAAWAAESPIPTIVYANVDQSFPKGKAMADWLMHVGASTTKGEVTIIEARKDLTKIVAPAQRWIYSDPYESVQHFTFNTPVGAAPESQCGRVVYSNFHVAGASLPGTPTIMACTAGPLSAQEKILEFMFFDLSSCVQKDGSLPETTVIK